MKRRIISTIFYLLAAVWVAVGVLWVRSYYRHDSFMSRPINDPKNSIEMWDGFSSIGWLGLQYQHDTAAADAEIFGGLPRGT